jgi:hypothetical protein
MTRDLRGRMRDNRKTKNPPTGITPMTRCLIPNLICFYEDIRTAPGHRLFAVRQHIAQQQAQ